MYLTIRNLDWAPRCMATLSYANIWPGNGAEVHRHVAAFNRRLVALGLRGVYKVEFQGRGAPHVHVWLSVALPKALLQEWWLTSMGRFAQRGYHEDQRVHWAMWEGGSARVALYAAGYAKKSEGLKAYQNRVPFGYRHPGRFWGVIGPRAPVVRVVMGVREVRYLRRGYLSKRRGWKCRRKWSDRGRVGFTVYDMSALAGMLCGRGARAAPGG